MRVRIIVGAALIVASIGAVGLGARGTSYVGPDHQWTIVNFADPVLVKGQFVMGPVLIAHDDTKMASGEACTTFYRFDQAKGVQEALVSFHCTPKHADTVAETTLTTYSNEPGCKRLVAYQIAGDSEVHQIPAR
jgi:hypothetical protein